MPDELATFAARRPTQPALASADTGLVLTWAELDDRVARLAHALRVHLALDAGARVALLAENDPRILELQFACMRAGLVLVPLNWRLAVNELVSLCEDAGPAVLFHDGSWQEVAAVTANQAKIPSLVGWGASPVGSSYDELTRASEPRPSGGDHGLDDPTHILYTSGTTGTPKGAISTRRTLLGQTLNITGAEGLGVDPGAHLLNPLPLFHAGGLNSLANPVLMQGGRVTTMARFEPEQVLAFLGDPANGVTHFAAVPTMYQMLAERQEFDRVDLSGLRRAVVAGGVASPEILRRFAAHGAPLEVQYGGTEMGPTITILDPADLERAVAGSCGRQVRHTDVRVVDADGEDASDGEPGEVWVRGPSITPGYWNRPKAEFFSGDWFRTGDVARRDERGYYFIVDRLKDVYKSGGENVSPSEVEAVLRACPGIADVVVIGVPDRRWGEIGVAVIVPQPGGRITLDEVEAHCSGVLARYKRPKRIVLMEQLPRNATGKVAKAELRASITADRGPGGFTP